MAVFVPDFAYKGGTITDFLNKDKPILDGAWDVDAFVSGGEIFAYVSASVDHGIQLVNFSNAISGLLPFEFSVTDAEVGGLYSPREIELVTIGTSTFLITASHKLQSNEDPGTLSVFLMDRTQGESFGDLSLIDSVTSDTALRGLTDFTVARFGFKTFIVGVSQSTNTMSVISVGSDGTLGRVRTVTEHGNPSLPLNEVVDVAYGYFNDQRYIVSATRGLEGLGLWRMSSFGTLTLVDTAKPNLDAATGINGFQTAGIHIAQVSNGVSVAFVYDASSHSVMSYTFANDEFTFRSSVSLGSAFASDAMVEMKTLDYMGETFLVTSNAGNSTVSLFHMAIDGSLALLQSFGNAEPALIGPGTSYLNNTQGLDIVELDGRLVVVAASTTGGSGGGVTMMEIGAGAAGNFEGGADDDKFFNFSRDTLARGNGGDDLFRAGLGSLSAYGGTGNDDWRGSAEDEFAFGGSGNDILSGGSGNDTIHGWADTGETVNPNEGDADKIYGGKGKDEIRAGQANDSVYGGDDADTLYGDFGDDLIEGGKGNDLIYGGVGNDTMDGGTGKDDFVFFTTSTPNDDQIDRFQIALDQIKFRGPGLDNFVQVRNASEQSGLDVVITLPLGNTLTLTNIDREDLTAANFLFD